MSDCLRGIARFATMVLMLLMLSGCGSDEYTARPDILQTPEAELHGASVKASLYEFRAKVRKHGAEGARQELPTLIESFEGYEDQPVGEHLETYTQIDAKLKELDSMLAGSPTKEQVVAVAEEIGTLADKLPGKADENPSVE
ncbi:MAG: hypothetical protein ACREIV_02050 [Planctomycetaceae bacterium]